MRTKRKSSHARISPLSSLMMTLPAFGLFIGGCSTVKSIFALDQPSAQQPPIQNPFDPQYGQTPSKDNVILRTKKGDRAVEVELPGDTGEMSDFVIPVSPAFRDDGRSIASSDGLIDERYHERTPGISDREIASTLPQAKSEDEGSRREIESGTRSHTLGRGHAPLGSELSCSHGSR